MSTTTTPALPALALRLLTLLRRLADRLAFVGPTLARLAIGLVFLRSGWGKLHNLDGVTEFFTGLGIPAPGFQAVLVATTELVGGSLVILGLGARLASLPLATTMVVAL